MKNAATLLAIMEESRKLCTRKPKGKKKKESSPETQWNLRQIHSTHFFPSKQEIKKKDGVVAVSSDFYTAVDTQSVQRGPFGISHGRMGLDVQELEFAFTTLLQTCFSPDLFSPFLIFYGPPVALLGWHPHSYLAQYDDGDEGNIINVFFLSTVMTLSYAISSSRPI